MNHRNSVLILILGFSVALFMLRLGSCRLNSELENAMSLVDSLQEENVGLRSEIDEKGREIASTQAVVLQQNGIIENQLKEIEELQELKQKIVYRSKTFYDTLEVALTDTIIIDRDSLATKRFNFSDRWLVLDGYIANERIVFDSLAVFNSYTIEQGRQKIGLWKYQTSVFVRNENPHTRAMELQSIVIAENKKWYEKGIWKVGLGFVGGYLLSKR